MAHLIKTESTFNLKSCASYDEQFINHITVHRIKVSHPRANTLNLNGKSKINEDLVTCQLNLEK